MNQQPERAPQNRVSRDGLAAVAIALITVVLIVVVVTAII